jgi:hypothetical protein
MKPVAANFWIVWMSPVSIDSTVIAANCSSWDPGFTKDAGSAVATAADPLLLLLLLLVAQRTIRAASLLL